MSELLVGLAFAVAFAAAVRGLWSPCGVSMVSTLNPLAERGRGHRWAFTLAWHVAGGSAGGALLGLCCAAGAYGYGRLALPPAVTWSAVAAGAALTLAADLRAGVRLPDRPRQVDQRWITSYRRWVYATGFGAQLGVGVATYVMTAATYLAAWLAVLTGNPVTAVLVGVAYGTARGAMLLLAGGTSTPQRLRTRLAGIEAWRGRSLLGAEAVQLAVVAVAGAAFAPALAAVVLPAALWWTRPPRSAAGTALRASQPPTLPRARAIR